MTSSIDRFSRCVSIGPNVALADQILNKSYLIANGIIYRICEIEMYCYSKQHPDPYVHCHADQSTFGKWYFHRFDNGSYKGGTFKGLDLTLGSSSKDATYFGVLIRSICRYVPGSGFLFTEGPCKCINTLLENLQVKSIQEYTDGKCVSALDLELRTSTQDIRDSDFKGKLRLVDADCKTGQILSIENAEIYSGPRIGLNPATSAEYFSKKIPICDLASIYQKE
jgi:hypothetical protein